MFCVSMKFKKTKSSRPKRGVCLEGWQSYLMDTVEGSLATQNLQNFFKLSPELLNNLLTLRYV